MGSTDIAPETRTEADLLGSGMAKAAGAAMRVLTARITALEFQLDVARDPHAGNCATGEWDTCTCGLRELMTAL